MYLFLMYFLGLNGHVTRLFRLQPVMSSVQFSLFPLKHLRADDVAKQLHRNPDTEFGP